MVVIEPPSSDLPDPLHGYSILSLFPRTFRDSKDVPNANGSDNLESIHNYMKSMALRSPDKHFKKAKAIVHGGSELLNSKLASFAASENNNEAAAAAAKGKGNPQERRPALGRKRARFSLKANTSQPSVSLEPSLDIDQLQDPEKFFLAYERLEYAKNEIRRQTSGNMTEKIEYNPSANPRRRRPGILGKSVSYKHHYSSVVSENDDTLISSQETLQQDSLSPSNFDSQQETTNPNVESQERELAGSISKTENRVKELFDELLSRNIENLDGDGALSLLQERLQIKPVDVDKYLRDFSDIGRTDFVVLEEQLPKSRKTLSNIQNMVKGLSGKTPVKHKQVAKNPVHSLASPTPPKNPFAALSLLKKRISQSNPYRDPFSALDIDLSPARSPSVEHFNRQPDELDAGKKLSISGKLKSPVEDEAINTAVASTASKKVMAGDSVNLFDKSVFDNMSSIDIDIGSSGSRGDLMDHKESNHMDDSARPNADTNIWTNGANKMAENMQAGDIWREAVSSAQPEINIEESTRAYTDIVLRTNGLNEMEGNVEDMQQEAASFAQPDVKFADSTTENLKNSQSQLGQPNSTVSEDHSMDGPSTTPEIGPEQQNEERSKSSLNERSKARRPREWRERNALSRRQSLAAAGTFWESGVRKSNRIKMRPLEYWKGERFLYGRVHESLTTVIGLKYMSSTKGDGEPTFRVKSYVADEHKELVELAALH